MGTTGDGTPVVGKSDVFDAFEITFKQREGRILFNEVEKEK